MKSVISYIFVSLFLTLTYSQDAASQPLDRSTRQLIIEGNKLFNNGRFAEAEESYRKALEAAPQSEVARYNLASALLRQNNGSEGGAQLLNQAMQIFSDLATNSQDTNISELAAYNLGNALFNNQKYAESIEMYKQALRRNPDNDKARDNLRIAQLKKEQQDQNQNQNQNQNQDQDQDNDQNEDQNQQNDQNQQDQNQQNDQQNQDQQQQPQDPRHEQQNITDQNAEAILKTMQNKENETRRRLEEKKKKAAPRRPVTHPW